MFRLALQLAVLILSWIAVNTASADTQYFHKTFAGRIDGRYAFTMDLKNVDGTLTGSYRYAGKRNDIYLNGKIDPTGAFTMGETGSGGEHTGTFTGKLASDMLDGSWASSKGNRHMAVEAHQISEILIGSKRDILTRAIGTYVLDSISGAAGANTMSDTWRDRGRWQSNVSAISMGQRETSDVTLTHQDLRRLNTMTITVDSALNVRLGADGKVLLSIPYRDSGMQYDFNRSHDSVVEDELKKMSPATTVSDEHLYLLASDAIDLTAAMSGNYLLEDTLDIVTISYAVVDKTFAVYLRNGDCCGGTVFTFRRKER